MLNDNILNIGTNYYTEIQTYLENLMKHLTIALLLSLLFFVTPVLAGSGHSHGPSQKQTPISIEAAASRASEIVKTLASDGKIDATWVGLKESKVEQKTFNQGPEWVVIYQNEKISSVSEQTLYLFLTLSGEYIAANYSGS